jgi:ABC-type iron transport system FetAB ATPase subunit
VTSLVIALELQPDILLLDESTSALDEVTCKLVEHLLIESKILIVAVTHSKEQLN